MGFGLFAARRRAYYNLEVCSPILYCTVPVKMPKPFYRKNLARLLSGVALLSVLSGCQSDRSSKSLAVWDSEDQASDDLMKGFGEMRSSHAMAMHDGAVRRDGEIPPLYWSDSIKSLNPIKVYWDNCNTVIVQKITDGVEYGKYISPPYSSYGAQSEYHLTKKRGPVADYWKRIAN